MEVGVRLVGIILRILNFISYPLFWLCARNGRAVPPPTNPLLLCSTKRLAEAIRNGEHTSEEIVSAYIERIKEVNPLLNAVVEERFQAALGEARAVDKRIAAARETGGLEELVKGKPLMGVPFTVKESCAVGGMSFSVGCIDQSGRRAPQDGAAVRSVRLAGAIPLLVSNTPEMCLGWETNNPLHGQTNNPYDLSRTPGGSSGGEAALLGAAASPFSVSSDVAGSIRIPAAFCGVFGHKPTPGIISIEGHNPTLSDPQFPKFLVIGPMARRAEDLPLLMRVMAGDNARKLDLDTPVDLTKVKVYYMTEGAVSPALVPTSRAIRDSVLGAARYLRDCGCTLREEKFTELEDSVELSISEFFSMKDIPNMLADPANPKRDKSLLIEMVKSLWGVGARSLQALGFALIARTRLFVPRARAALYRRRARALADTLTNVLGTDGVFLYPVFNDVAHYHNQVFGRASGVVYSMAFNVLGAPATAVPTGLRANLPTAVQVIAAPNQDRLCLAVAARLEAGFGGWRAPR